MGRDPSAGRGLVGAIGLGRSTSPASARLGRSDRTVSREEAGPHPSHFPLQFCLTMRVWATLTLDSCPSHFPSPLLLVPMFLAPLYHTPFPSRVLASFLNLSGPLYFHRFSPYPASCPSTHISLCPPPPVRPRFKQYQEERKIHPPDKTRPWPVVLMRWVIYFNEYWYPLSSLQWCFYAILVAYMLFSGSLAFYLNPDMVCYAYMPYIIMCGLINRAATRPVA